MSWFDEVTGSNERERQSWRDSYNGGRAAGDWTGNTNARLDSERDRFQGATWSGSSSQPSALELARSMVGRGVASVTSGTGSTGTGPGNPGVTTAAPRKSSGGNLTFAPGGVGPTRQAAGMLPKDKQLERIGNGGPQESWGAISDIGWVNTGTGYLPVPSSDVKERLEDNVFLESLWFARNYVMPHVGLSEYPRPEFLDPAYSHFDAWSGEWRHGTQTRSGGVRTGGGF